MDDAGRNAPAFVFLQGPIWAENHTQTQGLNCGDYILIQVMWDASSFYAEYGEPNETGM